MIAIRNFSDRLRSPGLLYDRSRSWSRSSTALHVTSSVTWPPKMMWGSTVSYPSDSLASCSPSNSPNAVVFGSVMMLQKCARYHYSGIRKARGNECCKQAVGRLLLATAIAR